MTDGRRADSARRHQRVLQAINEAVTGAEPLSLAGLARRAGVDRSFLYRHSDLLEALHAAQSQLSSRTGNETTVTVASLQADLLNSQQRTVRLTKRVQQLEGRLSETLGEQTWAQAGLGAPHDVDKLQGRIVLLEQQVADLRLQLEERDQQLDAARAANRQLMTHINTPGAI